MISILLIVLFFLVLVVLRVEVVRLERIFQGSGNSLRPLRVDYHAWILIFLLLNRLMEVMIVVEHCLEVGRLLVYSFPFLGILDSEEHLLVIHLVGGWVTLECVLMLI